MNRNIPALAAVIALIWTAALGASAAHAAGTGYTQTRYPIVLAHGLFGFDAIGPADYFFGVAGALRRDGAEVYTTQQSAANSSEARGEQLLAELKRLKAAHGHQKFNLVGHSHGGHTIRYVAAVAPELVASVTTIGAPHQGSAVADTLYAVTQATGTTPLAAGIANALASIISTISGAPRLPQNTEAALKSLSSAGSKAFNQRFPAGAPTSNCGSGAAVVNGVRYYSAGGTSVVTNPLDADSALAITSVLFLGKANDGVVERCSSRWGTVLRDNYPWNHLDQVNQTFGLRGWFTPDPVAFYRTQANRLKNAGL